jgi:hypothetical protein
MEAGIAESSCGTTLQKALENSVLQNIARQKNLQERSGWILQNSQAIRYIQKDAQRISNAERHFATA